MTSQKIVFIGCGNMGGAMLRGFLESFPENNYSVVKPTPHDFPNVGYYPDLETSAETLKAADIIFFAVKPQIMRDLLSDAKPYIADDTLLITIAAGIKLATYEKFFPKNPIIKTLPNTPSAVGKGMNILTANTDSQTHIENVNALFAALGKTLWLNNEDDIDAASAISASGPAYLFYIIEALALAGEEMGLASDDSMALARQTIIGAAALADKDNDTPASTLRENVTSKGGMTKAALDIFMNGEMQDIFDRALKAARDRSKELSA